MYSINITIDRSLILLLLFVDLILSSSNGLTNTADNETDEVTVLLKWFICTLYAVK